MIDTGNLNLPYWLMNSEELGEMFIESNEQNSHNQVSQFRQAVIENKVSHHTSGGEINTSYDSPAYFSLSEVINYLYNLNAEMVGKGSGEDGSPKLKDGTYVKDRSSRYFRERCRFADPNSSPTARVSGGPFNGEFNRFLMRLDARLNDKRLNFLLGPRKVDGAEYKTADLAELLYQFTGYGIPKRNVTIIDLSGIPFEVLSVVVSLISRLIFSFSFYFRKSKSVGESDLPYLLVYEEAHNYIPRSEGAKYGSVKKAIERIAKEGRKYGISLMIVSQRPSEISETVFSQCNNFVAMRLTNPSDQQYVKRLLPDTVSAITDGLPSLEKQEVIVIGDSIAIPSVVRVDDVLHRPDSRDINFHTEWKKDWLDLAIPLILEKWTK